MPKTISEERLRELEGKAAATERLHNAPGGTPWPRQSLKVVEVPYGELLALIAGYREREESPKAQKRVASKLRRVQDFVAGAWALGDTDAND